MKIVKKKKMHVESIKYNFIELIHLRKIISRVVSFRLIYIIVCLTMNVFIDDVKIKTLFNNDIEINYMLKRLIDATQFFIRQKINIVMMNFVDERVHFFDVYKSIFINIENITISIFIFVIERLNHDFLLNYFFNELFV